MSPGGKNKPKSKKKSKPDSTEAWGLSYSDAAVYGLGLAASAALGMYVASRGKPTPSEKYKDDAAVSDSPPDAHDGSSPLHHHGASPAAVAAAAAAAAASGEDDAREIDSVDRDRVVADSDSFSRDEPSYPPVPLAHISSTRPPEESSLKLTPPRTVSHISTTPHMRRPVLRDIAFSHTYPIVDYFDSHLGKFIPHFSFALAAPSPPLLHHVPPLIGHYHGPLLPAHLPPIPHAAVEAADAAASRQHLEQAALVIFIRLVREMIDAEEDDAKKNWLNQMADLTSLPPEARSMLTPGDIDDQLETKIKNYISDKFREYTAMLGGV